MALVPYTQRELNEYIQMSNEPSTKEFHFFNKLPYDLRHKIWELSISHYRHVKVFLANKETDENDDQQDDKIIETKDETPYEIFIEMDSTFHPLLYTSSESRAVAKLFYRVQLPCRRMDYDGSYAGTLFLCPELDTIEVDTPKSLQHFGHFADDVFTADRHNVGLVNLALKSQFVHTAGLLPLDDAHERTLFTNAIRRLEVLVIVQKAAKPELLMYGSDLRIINSSRRLVATRIQTEEFDRGSFDRDSRMYEHDLKAVHIGKEDPRRGYYSFWNLVLELKIPIDDDDFNLADELFMLTHDDAQEQEGHQRPPPAIGFWTFPLDSIGPFFFGDLNPWTGLPDDDWEGKMWEDRVLDLSEFEAGFCFYHPAY